MFIPNNRELIDKNNSFENGASNLTKESFTFVALIGTGSFGKVYKVSSKATNQIYALKVLSKNQISSLKLTEQLKNEITILSRCNHENIIKLYAVFEDKGYIFLITELANDSSLFSKLRKTRKFSESTTAGYMADIIQALVYLHSQKPIILHRDIKPENILINNSKCKIADFGWSNVEDDFRNTFCGTPDYLAPEMIQGTGHNEKLDVWTAGILMYELLHGVPPFTPKEKPSDPRLMQRMIEKNILSGIIEFDPSLSNEAKQAIITMLNPNSKERPMAKDVLELDFFKRYSKTMTRNGSETNINANFQSNKNSEVELATLRAKLREMELKVESLMTSNKNLNDLLESKESKFRIINNECEDYKLKYLKLKEETDYDMKNRTRGTNEFQGMRGSSSNPHGNSVEELQKEVARYKYELDKSQDTTKIIFERTKGISIKVSEFHMKHIMSQELNQTQEFVLSFDSTLTKLDAIFEDYLRMKNKYSTNNKVSIFSDASKETTTNLVFRKSRSPRKQQVVQGDEQQRMQNLHKNITNNDNSIKTYLSPMAFKKL